MSLNYIERESNKFTHLERVILTLHGYGSKGQNMLDALESMRIIMPDTLFISPNGPEISDHLTYTYNEDFSKQDAAGYQWFTLADRSPEKLIVGLKNSTKVLEEFISEQCNRLNVSPKKFYVFGFSQGGYIAVYMALFGKITLGGYISCGGGFMYHNDVNLINYSSTRKICLLHGKADSIVPYQYSIVAKELLEQAGIKTTLSLFDNADHVITTAMRREARNFIMPYQAGVSMPF